MVHIFLFAFYTFISVYSSSLNEQMKSSINQLYNQLNSDSYWNKNQKYIFPIKWQHQKGIYSSRVHFNIVDKVNSYPIAQMREHLKVDDINMFVTSFVLYGLIQAQELQTIKIDDHRFSQSLEAINGFRDKNMPKGLPQYSFWNQIDVNGTWVPYATNLLNSINKLPELPENIQNFLAQIGLGYLGSARDIAKYFIIPPDMDDSSVNLALLSFLKDTKSPHFQFWNSFNYKKQQFYERTLKYAYRPFGPDKSLNPHADEIDPRTYFVLHKFLQKKKQQSQNPSLILPTTWLISQNQQIQGKLIMPFRVNNVDATVSANFLFGICYQVLQKQIKLNDQLRQMMVDTTDLLVYATQQMIKERPSLILVYYPSKFDFYWFVSRIVHLLKRFPDSQDPLPEILSKLQNLMKTTATQQIFNAVHTNKKGEKYWAQFLGNYGKKQRNQDALFSTCLAINALIDTWTTRNLSHIQYDEDVTDQVKKIVQEGVKYIVKAIKNKDSQMNAFFSGSVKNLFTTIPFIYPSNVNYNDKHPYVDPQTTKPNDIKFDNVCLMKGYISKEQYQEMLKKKWFTYDVPIDEVSLNNGIGMQFPFWSSEAITQIMGITALSKALKLSGEIKQSKNLSHQ